MRLFIAAELPEPVRDALAAWTRAAVGRGADPRRVDPGALHLTLAFLGEQPASALDALRAALDACAAPLDTVRDLRLGAPAWLSPRRPRVLAVEVGDPDGTLGALHAALLAQLAAAIAFAPARERFRPHVTVARMRPGSQRARALEPTPALSFAPVAATLFRSTLRPDGARYDALASLAAAPSSVRDIAYGD